MSVKLLTERYLEFLSLTGGCKGSSESTHVKMSHSWKSHVTAYIFSVMDTYLVMDAREVKKTSGMNVLGIVVFSIFFGAVISKMGPAGKPLADFFEAMHQATMKLTMLVIWYVCKPALLKICKEHCMVC